MFKCLQWSILTNCPQPCRPIVAPGQNPALVAIEDRAKDPFPVFENLERFILAYCLTFSRILDRSQLEFPTVRSSRFVVGFLCLSSLANAAGGKFANELCGRWTL